MRIFNLFLQKVQWLSERDFHISESSHYQRDVKIQLWQSEKNLIGSVLWSERLWIGQEISAPWKARVSMKHKSLYSLKETLITHQIGCPSSVVPIIHTNAQSCMYSTHARYKVVVPATCLRAVLFTWQRQGKDGESTRKCLWKTKTMESFQEDSCPIHDHMTDYLIYWLIIYFFLKDQKVSIWDITRLNYKPLLNYAPHYEFWIDWHYLCHYKGILRQSQCQN